MNICWILSINRLVIPLDFDVFNVLNQSSAFDFNKMELVSWMHVEFKLEEIIVLDKMTNF